MVVWPARVVTFVLTDIVGSTEVWEAHPAEMAVALAAHDELVGAAVGDHRGVLVKARGEGDSTFSVFERASDAVCAAVAIQRAVASSSWPVSLALRVAVHTGEVQLRDGDYFGTTVNRAARLRSVAVGGEVVCSRATAALVADSLPDGVTLVDRGEQMLKGLSRPERVLTLQGAGLALPPAPGPSKARRPFVGRAAALDVASGCLAEALTGAGGVLLISGEPGIGKTRLAEVVCERGADQGARVAWGQCVADEGAPPFWPWRQILRRLESDVLEGGQVTGARLVIPPSGEERFGLFEAVTGAVREAATATGLVVVLDDVHWCDPASAAMLAHVARDVGTAGILLIVTYRDREVTGPVSGALAALNRERGSAQLALSGFGEVDVAEQLAATFGRRFPVEVVAAVTRRTGGNPFFVGEIGRLLDTPGWEGELPEGVRGAVGQRLERIPASARAVLRTAAIVGLPALAAVSGLPREEILAAIDVACRAGLIVADGAGYRFGHDLVRETLVEEVALPQRLALHAAAADHAADAAQIAHHLLSAVPIVDTDRAVAAAEQAAADATRRLAWEDSARWYERALHVAAPTRHIPLLLAKATTEVRALRLDSADASIRRAADLARAAGDGDALAQAALVMEGFSHAQTGSGTRLLCDEALESLPAGDSALRGRLLALLAVEHATDGDTGIAGPLSLEAVAMSERLGDSGVLGAALRARQMACSGPDGTEERLELGSRLIAVGDPESVMWGRLWRFDALVQLGEVDAAETELGPAADAARSAGLPVGAWHVLRDRIALAIGRGQFAEALMRSEELVAYAERAGDTGVMLSSSVTLSLIAEARGEDAPPRERGPVVTPNLLGDALIHLQNGRIDEARAIYERAPSLDRVKAFMVLPYAGILSDLASAFGDESTAAAVYDWLAPFAERHLCGGAGLVATYGSAHLALGTAAKTCGRLDVAVRHLRAAIESNHRAGLVPFEARAQCALADTLAARDRHGDRAEAVLLAEDALSTATRLGMRPLQERASRLLDSLRSGNSPLTRRELEIAALVGRGLTNRQIAEVAHISERTAENHVQHILTKLGLQNRAQIAAWSAGQNVKPRGA